MKLFTSIYESKEEYSLDMAQFEQYMAAVAKKLPKEVEIACFYLKKAQILTMEDAEALLSASGSKLKSIAKAKQVPESDLQDLQKIMKKMKLEKRLLPMYQTDEERDAFIAGTKTTDDIMLDLVSERGRAAVVKQYTPLMNKLANQYAGKSALSKPELMSAAMMGLVQAMNDYRKNEKELDADTQDPDKEETKKHHRMTFQSYAAYRMQQRILMDINWYSRTVRIPGKTQQRHKDDENFNFSTQSIDKLIGGDPDSESIADRMKELAVDPAHFEVGAAKREAENAMKGIFKMIEDRFNTQKAAVFYMTFGLNGYDMERQTDIAKKFGLSTQNVSMINKRIAKFLKETPAAQPLLKTLLQHCQESILVDNMNKTQQEIVEALLSSDMYLLLEELTRFQEPTVLENTLRGVLNEYDRESAEFITKCLESEQTWIEDNYRENRKLIVHFLESINPTQSFCKKSDIFIIEELASLSDAYKRAEIKL